MLFAIITWVRASRWVARAADSSAPWPSSSSQRSSQVIAVALASSWRSCARNRETKLGGQRGVVADEAVEGVDQLHRPRGVGSAEAARPVVGQGELLEALDGAERHSTHVLHQPEPEHRRQRPELADGERCHLLERGGEGADVLRVEPALGVGDETDRQVVDPRVTGERTVGEVGQLPVVPARKILADLAMWSRTT